MGQIKLNIKRNHLIHILKKEISYKLLMVLPLLFDISNQLQIVSRWFNSISCCSGAILGCTALIKELCGVKHRGGLLSLLQPNQSDCAEPPSEHTGPFLFSWYVGISMMHKQQRAFLYFWNWLFLLNTGDILKKIWIYLKTLHFNSLQRGISKGKMNAWGLKRHYSIPGIYALWLWIPHSCIMYHEL